MGAKNGSNGRRSRGRKGCVRKTGVKQEILVGRARASHGDGLGGRELVAAVKVNHQRRGGVHSVVEDDHRPGIDEVAGNAWRRAIGRVAVAPIGVPPGLDALYTLSVSAISGS